MNILVYDIAAESSGALSVLNDFYCEVKACEAPHHWYFILGVPELKNTNRITVLNFPWAKKNWINRVLFDVFYGPSLCRKYNIDKVLSLQNIVIPRIGCPQILYMHNCLPFISYRFSLRENRLYWIYQNVIGRLVKRSLRKANTIIVQSQWIKELCSPYAKSEKIHVIWPKVSMVPTARYEDNLQNRRTFIYPATAQVYKNHRVILEACKRLSEMGVSDYKIIFTICETDNDISLGLMGIVKKYNLPVEFVGELKREKLFELYTKSVLVFPSYIETFGIPLLEARLAGMIICASDCPFSREILKGYDNATLFHHEDSMKLGNLMQGILDGKFIYHNCEEYIRKKVEESMVEVTLEG